MTTITLNRQDLIEIAKKLSDNPDVDPFRITVENQSSTEYKVVVTTLSGEKL